MLVSVVAPRTSRVSLRVVVPVTATLESNCAASLARNAPSTVAVPPTVRFVPISAAPLVVSVVTEVAAALTAARVEVPVTASVPPTVAAPVTSAVAKVEAPAVSPVSVVAPVTPSVDPSVVAPETLTVESNCAADLTCDVPSTTMLPPTVALLVIAADARVESPAVNPASVVSPVTPRVPPTVAAPDTPRVVPTVAAPVTVAEANVEAPAVRPASVVAPATSRVSPSTVAPATSRSTRVPTDVSEELTTEEPRVVALRISTLLIL